MSWHLLIPFPISRRCNLEKFCYRSWCPHSSFACLLWGHYDRLDGSSYHLNATLQPHEPVDLSPLRRVQLWNWFITDFPHLPRFLFCPFCNVWRFCPRRLLSPSAGTERWEGRRGCWHALGFAPSQSKVGRFRSSFSHMGFPFPDLWDCDCNSLPREHSQRGDYKWQPAPHYRSQSRGARESQTGTGTRQRGQIRGDKDNAS